MNKVINGKLYDTTKAEHLGGYEFSHQRDFNWVCENLYQKESGEYFMTCEGGPMTEYKEYSGCNSWGYGSKIVPLTEEEAKAWAEDRLTGDEYVAIFGAVDEDVEKG